MQQARPLLALVLALALMPAAAALVGPAEPAPVRAAMDVSAYRDGTVTLPAGAPAPAGSVGIGPGSLLLIDIGSARYACTANYVWVAGSTTYLGAAGHCFLPKTAVATHGPGADFDASAVRTSVCVANCQFGGQVGFTLHGDLVDLGRVAYARQSRSGIDIGNDFGVVEIPSRHLGLVRPDMPVYGRMTGFDTLGEGEITCHYGNAVGFGETFLTKARNGVGILTLPDGSWRAAVASYQGDSGAAFATCAPGDTVLRAPRAVGVLTHLTPTGVAGTTVPRAQALAAEAGLSLTASL